MYTKLKAHEGLNIIMRLVDFVYDQNDPIQAHLI